MYNQFGHHNDIFVLLMLRRISIRFNFFKLVQFNYAIFWCKTNLAGRRRIGRERDKGRALPPKPTKLHPYEGYSISKMFILPF